MRCLTDLYHTNWHGFRSNWLEGEIPPPPTGIDSDHVLAPHGHDQAKELADHIASLEKKPQMLFLSPFYRCIETSTPVAKELGLKIRVENGIGEWYRPGRSVIPEPASLDLLNKSFDNLDQEWKSLVTPSNKGETEQDILERCRDFWSKFLPLMEEKYPEVEYVMLVSHAASKIALGMSIMGYKSVRDEISFGEDKVLKAGACSLDIYDKEDTEWKLKVNGDTSFLSDGEEMNWHFNCRVEAGSDEDIRLRREEAERREKRKALKKPKDEDLEDVYVVLEVSSKDLIPEVDLANHVGHAPEIHQSFNLHTRRQRSAKASTNLIQHSSYNVSSYKPTLHLQISGIETDAPFAKVDDAIFQGKWQELVGTELLFSDKGEVIGTVKNHIQMTRGELFTHDQFKEREVRMLEESMGKVSVFETALQLAEEKEKKSEDQSQNQEQST